MARSKTDRNAIERAELQEDVLKLRLTGASYGAIAKHLTIPKSTAYDLAQDAISEITREPAEAVIDMEIQRLDVMLLGLWKQARNGDTKAISTVLRIMERRAKYLNLDAAVAPDTSGEARQALTDLMDAIRGTDIDNDEMAFASIAPGAEPVTTSATPPPSADTTDEDDE